MLPKLTVQNFKTTLPSSKKKVTYRPFLVSEQKILLTATESKDEQEIKDAVVQVINNCTFDKLKVLEMAIIDIEWLFLQLRIKSKGEGADYAFKCTECEVVNERTADLTKVVVKNKDASNVIQLTSDIGIKMKAPTYELAEHITGEMNASDIFSVIVDSIDLLYDGEEVHKAADSTAEELLEWLETLTEDQFLKIKDYFDKLPTLELNIEYKCTGCGHETEIVLKGLSDFLG